MNRATPQLFGMLHVPALPGTPFQRLTISETCRWVRAEAEQLQAAGFDGLVLENMHDRPYLRQQVGPEIVAAMTAVLCEVRARTELELGVQVLAGAGQETLAVAHAGGADFIRVENFVFAHVADEGLMAEAAAGPLLRYRKQIGAEQVRIFADIKKKHASHAVTADLSLAETVAGAAFSGADGVIVTGTATGRPAEVADVAEAGEASELPVLVGSGVTPEQIPQLAPHCAGFIVGSYLKEGGRWDQPLDPARVAAVARAVQELSA